MLGVHGAVVFSILTQYVVVITGETISVEAVWPAKGDVPNIDPVPH